LCFHSDAEPGDQSWDQKLKRADVVYITRPQKERWPSPDAYRLKNIVFSFAELSKMKEDAVVLHPGPRTAEMNPQVDRDERVAIWRQVKNGMYLRMALLKLLLGHT
jgi:aspartate carbamoyltransferase catalytic subunit